MGTIRRRTELQLASIATSKIYAITTAETLFRLGSGNVAFEATNLGSYSVYYGNSGFPLGSGGILIQYGAKFWDTITDNFQMAFKSNTAGVGSLFVVHEYAGA